MWTIPVDRNTKSKCLNTPHTPQDPYPVGLTGHYMFGKTS